MKYIMKVLLAALLLLFTIGVSGQVISSDNGDYHFYYLNEVTVVTNLADTICVGKNTVDIDDEGHIYHWQWSSVHGWMPIYINAPFIADYKYYGFEEYSGGALVQRMSIYDGTVHYKEVIDDQTFRFVEGFINNTTHFNLWNYNY